MGISNNIFYRWDSPLHWETEGKALTIVTAPYFCPQERFILLRFFTIHPWFDAVHSNRHPPAFDCAVAPNPHTRQALTQCL